MSETTDSIAETAENVQATKAEGELRRAAVDALKRAGLPENLIERTKTLPGTPFNHRDAFATLPDADRANLRKALKDFACFPVGDFDRLTAPTDDRGDGKQGRALVWDDPEPWPEPVDGAALLDELLALFDRYAMMPDGGAVAASLWSLYTWVFESFAVSPYLMITAPEREAGKSRVTELLSWIVHRAKPVSDASAASIFRGIERDGPTLLFDEAQTFLRRNPDDPMRGILLAGFVKRFANVERVVGEDHEVRTFSTYCPKAMNGRKLATIDDMLTSRSVVIAMMRATKRMPDIRADQDPVGEDVRSRCRRWANDNGAAMREADPEMDALFGRPADVWRPLFAVADAAGGDWPSLARAAAASLTASAAAVGSGESRGVMLLSDIRDVFGDRESMKSEDLDAALHALPERPWATYSRGKPITAQARGRMLTTYGIQSVEVPGRRKGYRREQFKEAWSAYLPGDSLDSNRGTVETLENKGVRRSANRGNGAESHGLRDGGNTTNAGASTVPRFEYPKTEEGETSMQSQFAGSTLGDAYRRRKDGE